jgi:hypothetical protein
VLKLSVVVVSRGKGKSKEPEMNEVNILFNVEVIFS